jgi:hypothetical protein
MSSKPVWRYQCESPYRGWIAAPCLSPVEITQHVYPFLRPCNSIPTASLADVISKFRETYHALRITSKTTVSGKALHLAN